MRALSAALCFATPLLAGAQGLAARNAEVRAPAAPLVPEPPRGGAGLLHVQAPAAPRAVATPSRPALAPRTAGGAAQPKLTAAQLTVERAESRPASLYPHVSDTLRTLGKNYRLALVSNNTQGTVVADDKKLIRQNDGARVFQVVMGARDDNGRVLPGRELKPKPDMLIKTAHELHLARGRGVYVGDSPDDMKAATAAGWTPVGIVGPGRAATKEELVAAGAKVIVRSVDQVPAAVKDIARSGAKVSTVGFDRDGTLVNSWNEYALAVQKGTIAIGKPLTLDQIRDKLSDRAWATNLDTLYQPQEKERFKEAFRAELVRLGTKP
jgi:phosphoglycolate phosphatase-like HAD superfamily hydrolase